MQIDVSLHVHPNMLFWVVSSLLIEIRRRNQLHHRFVAVAALATEGR
jgi:hypothetical protein